MKRSGFGTRRLPFRPRRRTVVIAFVIAAVGGGLGAYGADRILATGSPPGFPAPGVGGDVTAMRTLPPASGVPADVLQAVRADASDLGADPAAALASLRLLLPDVGPAHYQLYAYTGNGGATCLILWRSGGTCSSDGRTPDRGVGWLLGADTPAIHSPAAVVGVVADDVSAVTLEEPDGNQALPITNNAFFHELPQLPAGTPALPARFALFVTYTDGSSETITLPNP